MILIIKNQDKVLTAGFRITSTHDIVVCCDIKFLSNGKSL